MRFATYVSPRDGDDHVALVVDGALHGLPDRRLVDLRAPDRVFCDRSVRDLQAREMALGLGPAKGKDGATSLGPYLVTPEELPDRGPGTAPDLGMRALVNGELWSSGRLSDLHWTVGQLLAYASRGTELRAGDVLGTGTVGTGCILELSAVHGADARPYLRPGDQVRLEVDLLGAIDSTITPAPPVHPLR